MSASQNGNLQGDDDWAILQLRDELNLQQIVLESLQDPGEAINNRESAIQQVRDEIKSLKRELVLLRNPRKAPKPTSSSPASSAFATNPKTTHDQENAARTSNLKNGRSNTRLNSKT